MNRFRTLVVVGSLSATLFAAIKITTNNEVPIPSANAENGNEQLIEDLKTQDFSISQIPTQIAESKYCEDQTEDPHCWVCINPPTPQTYLAQSEAVRKAFIDRCPELGLGDTIEATFDRGAEGH